MGRLRTLAAAAGASLLFAPSALGASYKWTSEITSMAYTKSVCVRPPYTITEVVTQWWTYRSSGSGTAGTKRSPAKGSYQRGGEHRINYSRVVQGPDAAPPQDQSASEKLGSSTGKLSMVQRAGNVLKVDIGLSDMHPTFKPPAKGRSRVWTVDREETEPQRDEDNCTYDERTEDKGSVKLTRVN